MPGEDDHPPAGCDRAIHVLEAMRLNAPACFKDAYFPQVRVFGRDAAEIVPHAGDDTPDLGPRKLGKGTADVAPACLETPRNGPMRRASAPPRAEARSKGKSSNTPNRDAAPQASRRSANPGVLAERLGAGVLALGINCAIQVGIRFRRRRLSRSPCPPLRVASARSPTRLRSRNCRKDSRCRQFRAAAVRQIEASAPHWYPRERA